MNKEFWKTLYSACPSPQLVVEKVPVGRMRGVQALSSKNKLLLEIIAQAKPESEQAS